MEAFREFVTIWLSQTRRSAANVSAEAGIDQSLFSRYLHADPRRRVRPSPRNLEKLAPVLGVPYEDLMRMCGYLPGQASSTDDQDPIEAYVRARIPQMREAVDGIPRPMWATVINKLFDRAIDGARDMAQLLAEADSAPTPTNGRGAASDKASSERPIRRPRGSHGEITPAQLGRVPLLVGV